MRDSVDSEKVTREAELRRDFEFAIEGILALDPEPSGLVSSTRSFRFGKYDISICAQHSDKTRKRNQDEDDDASRLSPDERHLKKLLTTPIDDEWKTMWDSALQRPLILAKLGVRLDVPITPVITTTQTVQPPSLLLPHHLIFGDVISTLDRLESDTIQTGHVTVAPLTTLPLFPTIRSMCSAQTITPENISPLMSYVSRGVPNMTLVATSLGSIDSVPLRGEGVPAGLRRVGQILKDHVAMETSAARDADMIGGYLQVVDRYVPWMAKLSTKEFFLGDDGWDKECILMIFPNAIRHAYPQCSVANDDWIVISGTQLSTRHVSVMLRVLLAIRVHGMRIPSAIDIGLAGVWQHVLSNDLAFDKTVTALWCLNLLEDTTRVSDAYHELVRKKSLSV